MGSLKFAEETGQMLEDSSFYSNFVPDNLGPGEQQDKKWHKQNIVKNTDQFTVPLQNLLWNVPISCSVGQHMYTSYIRHVNNYLSQRRYRTVHYQGPGGNCYWMANFNEEPRANYIGHYVSPANRPTQNSTHSRLGSKYYCMLR